MRKETAKITSKSIEQSGLPSDYKKAIAEYIWNGFDANASIVTLDFDANEIGHIEEFSILDNGTGINLSNIDETFGHFLDSKKSRTFDKTGYVKGKKGKGRFSFVTFCNKATWETTFESENSDFLKYSISIEKDKLQDYQISEDKKVSNKKKTSTKVVFSSFRSLTGDLLQSEDFLDFLASEFGWFLFLNKESDYKVIVNGVEVDYWSIIAEFDELEENIKENDFKISFIRWSKNIGDKYYYYFLDQNQEEVERKHTSFNNKAIDFHHSVYIISDYFEKFKYTKLEQPTLGLNGNNQSDGVYKSLIIFLNSYVAEKEKHYVRDQQAEKLIEEFNEKKIFPSFRNNSYEQIRKKDLENVVKEIYCIQPKIFQGLKKPQSKTIVGFLNLLLDTDQREHILDILDNIIKLTDEERAELSGALKKTKLSGITAIVKLLENRFEVINLLKILVFDYEKFTNERDHIQKVVESNYWLFGEQYHLVSADKNFETTLNNYLKFLEEGREIKKEKLNQKERLKRPDIFIARQIETPDSKSNEFTIEENIIVELKRPSVIISKKQFDQIEEYIRFVINEPRFNSELRKWKLILVGKEVDDWIKDKYESHKEKGKRFLVDAVKNYEIYAMTWDDLFKIFDIRHKHLINKLEFKSSIMENLKEKGVLLDLNVPSELVKNVVND